MAWLYFPPSEYQPSTHTRTLTNPCFGNRKSLRNFREAAQRSSTLLLNPMKWQAGSLASSPCQWLLSCPACCALVPLPFFTLFPASPPPLLSQQMQVEKHIQEVDKDLKSFESEARQRECTAHHSCWLSLSPPFLLAFFANKRFLCCNHHVCLTWFCPPPISTLSFFSFFFLFCSCLFISFFLEGMRSFFTPDPE